MNFHHCTYFTRSVIRKICRVEKSKFIIVLNIEKVYVNFTISFLVSVLVNGYTMDQRITNLIGKIKSIK